MKNKWWIKEYEILRVTVTMLVVLSHCIYYKISSDYGGIDYIRYLYLDDIGDTMFHKIITVLSSVIYSFHMPLFMALSGAVFSIEMKRKNIRNFIW